jgi:hypothetical protein
MPSPPEREKVAHLSADTPLGDTPVQPEMDGHSSPSTNPLEVAAPLTVEDSAPSVIQSDEQPDKGWMKGRAGIDAPTSLPPQFRALWRNAYRTLRDSKPVVREREVNGKKYIYHETPTILEVMSEVANNILSTNILTLDGLNARIEELKELVSVAGWAELLVVARVRLLQLLLSEDPKEVMFGVGKVIGHIEKSMSNADREALKRLLEGNTDTAEEEMAAIQDFMEKRAQERKLFGGH